MYAPSLMSMPSDLKGAINEITLRHGILATSTFQARLAATPSLLIKHFA